MGIEVVIAEAIVLCVLYPSGTDFRTRMPTLIKPACVSAGSVGVNDDFAPSVRELVTPSQEKKEVIGAWYCFLRACMVEELILMCGEGSEVES
jgi:hypothetical protein